ncbi:uncharacterized protein BKA78DRAFT_372817 [Phyllosticta capitalensis]|uniref:uncharacterized protein n=1 Tax=Phyllosticta capitalensis TaxID=121624 RepID=UPI0031322E2A
MSSPTTIESRAPSYRRSFHYDRTPSPEPSSVGSRSMQPLSDGIALLPWNRVENFGALGPPRNGGSKRKWRQYLPAATRLKSLLVVFLRTLRLIFFTAIGPWKTLQEQPKVAIYQQWLPAVLALSVHIIPLAAAVTMLLLNLKTTIVERDISNTSLQYLAKVLELLTQASISAAAFTYFRIVYTSGDGVPFGAITAGLQLSSLSYLWSLDFLGSLLSTAFGGRRKIAFAFFVLASSLLTATVGPAIATCLIPKIQAIAVSHGEVYFSVPEDSMYPMRIDVDHVSDSCKSRNQSLSTLELCPFTGWEDLRQMAISSPWKEYQPAVYGVRPRHYSSQKFTIDYMSKATIKSKFPSLRRMRNLGLISFTAPSLRTLEHMIRKLFNTTLPEGTHHRQHAVFWQAPSPVATAFCQQASGDYRPLRYENFVRFRYLNPLDFKTYLELDFMALADSKDSHNSSNFEIHWFESNTPGISTVALISIPGHAVDVESYICPIIAGWANGTHKSVFNQYPVVTNLSWSNDPVSISPEWATLLCPRFRDTGISVIDSLLSYQTVDLMWEHNDTTFFYAESQILAGLIVNGMSTYRYNVSSRFPHLSAHRNSSTKYKNSFSIHFEGLAYSPQGLAVQLSIAVLATYVAYVLAFIIYTLGFNRTASFAWDSISELTALALLSKPPEKCLENTRAGIETVDLFKQQVHIRVVEDEKLELVFKDEDIGRQTSRIEPNHEY